MKTRNRSFIFFVFVVWVAALPVYKSLAGKIYWTDRGAGKVMRANSDGTKVETLVELKGFPNLRGIAVDAKGGMLYFADNAKDQIFSAKLDGSDLKVIVKKAAGLGFPADLTFHPGENKIYWCDQQTSKIRRANVDGSQVEDVVNTTQPYYLELSPKEKKIYWGTFYTSGRILRANFDGSEIETLIKEQPQVRAVKLDHANGKMYWVDREAHKIRRRDIKGGPVEDLYTGLDTPHGMVLDLVNRKIFWVDTGTNRVPNSKGAKAVCGGDMDGKTPMKVLVKANQPWDIDVIPDLAEEKAPEKPKEKAAVAK